MLKKNKNMGNLKKYDTYSLELNVKKVDVFLQNNISVHPWQFG